jgi:hypothetical protein
MRSPGPNWKWRITTASTATRTRAVSPGLYIGPPSGRFRAGKAMTDPPSLP